MSNATASNASPDATARLRQGVYWILISVSAGMILGRILAVDSVDELKREETLDRRLCRPFLSANDRSRWCTVRALVEPALRVPGAPYAIDKVQDRPRWDTIDMVKVHGHLYSSKPPLLATLMAGPYWLIYHFTGKTLEDEPYTIGRGLLIVFNLLPLVVYFWVLTRLAERFGTTDWGRLFVVAAGTLGTFLSTFAVVLNNHLPGAVCAAIALYGVVRIWFDGRRQWRYFLAAGFFGALMVSNELPSLALAALLGAVLLWQAPWRTLAAFAPAAAVVAAAFLATNWIALRSLSPAYANPAWYAFEYQHHGQTVKSYWLEPQGPDRGEPSRAVYALHSLVGHHGIFSLTPMWLLSAAGIGLWLRQRDDRRLRLLALLIATVSVACGVFYIGMQDLHHRSYGGMSSGFRWMFWFAPLWLVAMLPAADGLAGRRWTRGLALVLLVVSVLSVSYPTWNPWTHPWLFDYMNYWGLIPE